MRARFALLLISGLGIGFFLIKALLGDSPVGIGVYGSPSWSIDGRYLAFSYHNGNPDHLWILDTDTGKTTEIKIEGYFAQSGMRWQDKQTLFYVANDTLFRVDVTKNQSEPILNGAYSWQGFTFDNAHNTIIFSNRLLHPLNQYHSADLYSFSFADGKITQLTNTPDVSEDDPILSADGKYLAYVIVKDYDLDKGKRGKFGIEVQKIGETSHTLNVPVAIGINHFAWTPDGKWFVFRAASQNEAGLYRIRADGTDAEIKIPLAHEIEQGLAEFAWSLDGSKFAYTSVGVPGKNNVYIFSSLDLGFPYS